MYKKYIKRVIDIIISLIALILLSPIMLLISFCIIVFNQMPVIFTQNRTGKNGKNFRIYKFRTMKNKKVTRLGRVLRVTSLDELPQLINVLKGEMSIVGPRPWVPEYFDNFTEEQKKRVKVKPGLVGLAQVNGRNDIDVFRKIEYDNEYVKRISILLDIKIIIKSFRILYSKQNMNGSDGYIETEIKKF